MSYLPISITCLPTRNFSILSPFDASSPSLYAAGWDNLNKLLQGGIIKTKLLQGAIKIRLSFYPSETK